MFWLAYIVRANPISARESLIVLYQETVSLSMSDDVSIKK